MYKFYYQMKEPGTVLICEEEGNITEISFSEKINPDEPDIQETDLIRKTFLQLKEYLNGERENFDIPLTPKGTEFQRKVWDALCEIPYGETRSYKEIAERIGNPKGCRAVGMANNRNPISIIIPCHRVIGANGKLVGYGGGLPLKERLLNLEKVKSNEGKYKKY